jgi:hypothetical protein
VGGGWGGGKELSHGNGFSSRQLNVREFANTVNNFYIVLRALPYCNHVGQLISLFA